MRSGICQIPRHDWRSDLGPYPTDRFLPKCGRLPPRLDVAEGREWPESLSGARVLPLTGVGQRMFLLHVTAELVRGQLCCEERPCDVGELHIAVAKARGSWCGHTVESTGSGVT